MSNEQNSKPILIKNLLGFPVSLDNMPAAVVAETVASFLDLSAPRLTGKRVSDPDDRNVRYFEFETETLMLLIAKNVNKGLVKSINIASKKFYKESSHLSSVILKYQFSMRVDENQFNYKLLIKVKDAILQYNNF